MATKMLSPMKASTMDQVCSLNRDNYSRPDFWILAGDETVTICQQREGESTESMVSMPKAEFNRLIRWYMRPQKIRSAP